MSTCLSKSAFAALCMLTVGVNSSPADVTLPALYCDNMVVQRGKPVVVYGWADSGERVTVSIGGGKGSAISGSDGAWRVELPPVKAGGPYELTVEGKNRIVLNNVLSGDVWVCSGQSNMQWPLRYTSDAGQEAAAANHPDLRLFVVRKEASGSPRQDCHGQWEPCTFRNAPDFSAAGYYFGRELMRELDVPIGLIQSAWGGTPIEPWISLDTLDGSPDFRRELDGWERIIRERPPEIVEYYDLVSSWFVFAFVCMGQKKPYGKVPDPPEGYDRALWTPSWLFNAMIAPLTHVPVTGILWYQGESNAGRAYRYRTLFPALIEDWRRQWGDDRLPFIYAQLSTTRKRQEKPVESAWAELREAQLMALSLPSTGMAVTVDIGEEDVHFRNKREAGRRLALAALNTAYGHDIVHSGPVYRSVEFRDGRAYIEFDHTGSGLASLDGGTLTGFTVAAADSAFVNAHAAIEDGKVVVWSEDIAVPAAVRYGWSDHPACNLGNTEGLPASPFRTDSRPGTTWPDKQ